MKDLGELHHFLGITIERRPQGMLLHQRQYTIDILERAGVSVYAMCLGPCTSLYSYPLGLACGISYPKQLAWLIVSPARLQWTLKARSPTTAL
jgi:hypothetical protein